MGTGRRGGGRRRPALRDGQGGPDPSALRYRRWMSPRRIFASIGEGPLGRYLGHGRLGAALNGADDAIADGPMRIQLHGAAIEQPQAQQVVEARGRERQVRFPGRPGDGSRPSDHDALVHEAELAARQEVGAAGCPQQDLAGPQPAPDLERSGLHQDLAFRGRPGQELKAQVDGWSEGPGGGDPTDDVRHREQQAQPRTLRPGGPHLGTDGGPAPRPAIPVPHLQAEEGHEMLRIGLIGVACPGFPPRLGPPRLGQPGRPGRSSPPSWTSSPLSALSTAETLARHVARHEATAPTGGSSQRRREPIVFCHETPAKEAEP